MTLAHVGGFPIEETLPTLTPLAFVVAALARARLGGIRRRRRPSPANVRRTRR
jgi:hypothetical protein